MRITIQFTYSTPKGVKTSFISEEMSAGEAIVMAEDMQKTGRAQNIEFFDAEGNSWTLKLLKKWLEEAKTEPGNIKLYFDGGYDLASGKAGLGCAVYYEQNDKSYRLRRNASIDEMASNNEAEYAALDLGLKELEGLGVHHMPVEIIGDSKVVIHQLNGDWPCYEPELARWADRIENQLERMGLKPSYQAVSRKQNREADQLASQALNGLDVSSLIELD